MSFPEKEEYKVQAKKYWDEYKEYFPGLADDHDLIKQFEKYCEALDLVEKKAAAEVIKKGIDYCRYKRLNWKKPEFNWDVSEFLLSGPRTFIKHEVPVERTIDENGKIINEVNEKKNVPIKGVLDGQVNIGYEVLVKRGSREKSTIKEVKWIELEELSTDDFDHIFPRNPFDYLFDPEQMMLFYNNIVVEESKTLTDPILELKGEDVDRRKKAYKSWWKLIETKHRLANKYLKRVSFSKANDGDIDKTTSEDKLGELSKLEKVQLIEKVKERSEIKNYDEAIEIASKEAEQYLYKDYNSFKKARYDVREYL